MRVLMLGWEFPPFIAGGLGTACYGLTKALDRMGHEVVFVLPKSVDRSHASHITLLTPEDLDPPTPPESASAPTPEGTGPGAAAPTAPPPPPPPPTPPHSHSPGADAAASDAAQPANDASSSEGSASAREGEFERVEFREVPAPYESPYGDGGAVGEMSVEFRTGRSRHEIVREITPDGWIDATGAHHTGPVPEGAPREPGSPAAAQGGSGSGGDQGGAPGQARKAGDDYSGDPIENTRRYAATVAALAEREEFDLIHAHDWMTYPAGLMVKARSGKPLVAHIHSTEYDRAGEGGDARIREIERAGLSGADRVLAVSRLTKSVCMRRYGIPEARIDVVYNGIEQDSVQPKDGEIIGERDKIVLFLGRITMQKGPEFFVRAAKRVLEKAPDTKFLVAGSGDMAVRMIEEAAQLGIGSRVLFAGFLRGSQVDQAFRMASCYVMPSVSEPFGLAPLEAMRNNTPVIISKQSGVSEVVRHALKVDFWDVDDMANKIISVLRHAPLGAELRRHAPLELKRLTWDRAAVRCTEAYERTLSSSAQSALRS